MYFFFYVILSALKKCAMFVYNLFYSHMLDDKMSITIAWSFSLIYWKKTISFLIKKNSFCQKCKIDIHAASIFFYFKYNCREKTRFTCFKKKYYSAQFSFLDHVDWNEIHEKTQQLSRPTALKKKLNFFRSLYLYFTIIVTQQY